MYPFFGSRSTGSRFSPGVWPSSTVWPWPWSWTLFFGRALCGSSSAFAVSFIGFLLLFLFFVFLLVIFVIYPVRGWSGWPRSTAVGGARWVGGVRRWPRSWRHIQFLQKKRHFLIKSGILIQTRRFQMLYNHETKEIIQIFVKCAGKSFQVPCYLSRLPVCSFKLFVTSWFRDCDIAINLLSSKSILF